MWKLIICLFNIWIMASYLCMDVKLFTPCAVWYENFPLVQVYCYVTDPATLSQWIWGSLDLARTTADHCDFHLWLAVCKHQFAILPVLDMVSFCLLPVKTLHLTSVHKQHFAFYHISAFFDNCYQIPWTWSIIYHALFQLLCFCTHAKHA